MLASSAGEAEGTDYQGAMPEVPLPDALVPVEVQLAPHAAVSAAGGSTSSRSILGTWVRRRVSPWTRPKLPLRRAPAIFGLAGNRVCSTTQEVYFPTPRV